MKRTLLPCFLLLLWNDPAQACGIGLDMVHTFFSKMPVVLAQEPFAARVRIVRNKYWLSALKKASPETKPPLIKAAITFGDFYGLVEVEVIENIRGFLIGDLVTVRVANHSCSSIWAIAPGTEWFIAGKMEGDEFAGTWKYHDLYETGAMKP